MKWEMYVCLYTDSLGRLRSNNWSGYFLTCELVFMEDRRTLNLYVDHVDCFICR